VTHPSFTEHARHGLGTSIEGTVIAAVSGGADSMAMLHALRELSRQHSLRVIAAHFDHRLRAQSNDDLELVRRTADSLGVPFASGYGNVREHASSTRQSIEAAGRELRYAFLERIADELGADAIATAHTRDDQIETVLMRILFGAAARGRRGILARRGRIVRPMLSVSRADVEAYCRTNDIAFVTDPSNHDLHFERNRVRHVVLPEIRCVYPGIDGAMIRIAEAAQAEFDRAGLATARRLQVYLQPESQNAWLLGIDAFRRLDDPMDRTHMISEAIEAVNGRADVTSKHIEQLLNLVVADPGAVVDLPGVRVRREHDGVVFTRRGTAVVTDLSVRTLSVPGTLNVGCWQLDACEIDMPDSQEIAQSGKEVAYVRSDYALIVRFPREGDRMQPFGMSGHKKLSDLFIDRKVPQRLRAHTPIVESAGEIVWVAGVAVSESSRVYPSDRNVVRLTATRTRP
jgi:tRNA(Ile)-lysidine synthase